MVAWIAQGLEKVVPQPDAKTKDSAAEQPAEPPAEVRPPPAPPTSCLPSLWVLHRQHPCFFSSGVSGSTCAR